MLILLSYRTYALPTPEYDVTVVGAGISGLAAAYELKKKQPDIRVVVLEARDRVGGRTYSVNMRAANQIIERFDLGGQWLHSSQWQIVNLLAELGVPTFPQYAAGSRVTQFPPSNKITQIDSRPGTFTQIQQSDIQRIEALLADVDFEGALTNDARYDLWNRTTVSAAMNNMNLSQETVDSIDGLLASHFDSSSQDMSMLFFLMALKSTGMRLTVMLSAVPNGRRIAGGSQTLADRLSNSIDVRLEQEAVRVAIESNIVTVTTRQGRQFTSKKVIMAIPPVIASEIIFSPPLPQEKMALLRDLRPRGDDIKFVATYQSAFWRAANMTGNVQYRADDKRGIQANYEPISDVVTFDTTSAFNSPALVGYYIPSREYEPEEARKRAVLNIMARLLGNDMARNPIDYREMRWDSSVPFNKGGAGTLGTGQVPHNYAALLRAPSNGHIFWAGTETATEWTSYMNGAVQAGQRAAAEVLQQSQTVNADPIKALLTLPCSLFGLLCSTSNAS
uniref:Amine oxidase n=1 Tax=Plectus sambesii TaxID=2011161 RepID=A0A914WAQ0_9BILA